MMIGIAGAHRTGKTTLARAFAEKCDYVFVDASVSKIFKEIGFDPSANNYFSERLAAQFQVLERFDDILADYVGKLAITDRTFLDMAAYTLADIGVGKVPDECQDALKLYIDKCIDLTNKRFTAVVLVQPGIELVAPDDGKITAPLDKAYIEHLNMLMLGLCNDERLSNNIRTGKIARTTTDLAMRVQCVQSMQYACIEGAQVAKYYHMQYGGAVQ